MLQALSDTTKPGKGYMENQVKAEYSNILEDRPEDLESFQRWLGRWEVMIARAFRYKLLVTYSGRWLRDVIAAIEPMTEALTAQFLTGSLRLDDLTVDKGLDQQGQSDFQWDRQIPQRRPMATPPNLPRPIRRSTHTRGLLESYGHG